MRALLRWKKEDGARVEGTRTLDQSKVQAPGVVKIPGGWRLFYTAVGPAKPFAECQGYILSAVSQDGVTFQPEPGIRLTPQPQLPHMALRVLAPTVTRLANGDWRMYFESRGAADRPTVICSAISTDLLEWTIEEGIRLQSPGGLGGPRYLALPDGRGRLYCCRSEWGPEGLGGRRISQSVASAISSDGLNFGFEPGCRMRDKQGDLDSAGITAAEVLPPSDHDGNWTMFYSAWQEVPPGHATPVHPSHDPHAVATGRSADFAAASIASDMSGYRSRILVASSPDGLTWRRGQCVIEGLGYGQPGLDAVHAEDMSVIDIGHGRYRMYYAACDKDGHWRVASAVTE